MDREKSRRRQAGQGMTEYVIMVALVAVAAIGIVGFFGDTLRTQFYNMTSSLAGSSNSVKASGILGKAQKQTDQKRMGNFQP